VRGEPAIAHPAKPTRSFDLPRYERVTAQVEQKSDSGGARVCFLVSNYKDCLLALPAS